MLQLITDLSFYIKLLLTFFLIKSFCFKKKKETALQVELLPIEYYSPYWTIFQKGKAHETPILAEKRFAVY